MMISSPPWCYWWIASMFESSESREFEYTMHIATRLPTLGKRSFPSIRSFKLRVLLTLVPGYASAFPCCLKAERRAQGNRSNQASCPRHTLDIHIDRHVATCLVCWCTRTAILVVAMQLHGHGTPCQESQDLSCPNESCRQ